MKKPRSPRPTAQKDPGARTQSNGIFQLPLNDVDRHVTLVEMRERHTKVKTLVQKSAWRQRFSRVDETLAYGPSDVAHLSVTSGVEEDVGRACFLLGYVPAVYALRWVPI